MGNNNCERATKKVAFGRKNGPFTGSVQEDRLHNDGRHSDQKDMIAYEENALRERQGVLVRSDHRQRRVTDPSQALSQGTPNRPFQAALLEFLRGNGIGIGQAQSAKTVHEF